MEQTLEHKRKYSAFIRSFVDGSKTHIKGGDSLTLQGLPQRLPYGVNNVENELILGAIHSEHLSADLVWMDCDIPYSEGERLILSGLSPFQADRVVLFPSVGGRTHVLLRSSQNLGRLRDTICRKWPDLHLDRAANAQGTPLCGEQLIFSRPLTESGTLYKDLQSVQRLFQSEPHPIIELDPAENGGPSGTSGGILDLAKVPNWSTKGGSCDSAMAPFQAIRNQVKQKLAKQTTIPPELHSPLSGLVVIYLKNALSLGVSHHFDQGHHNVRDLEVLISMRDIQRLAGRHYGKVRAFLGSIFPVISRGGTGHLSIRSINWRMFAEWMGQRLYSAFRKLAQETLGKDTQIRKVWHTKKGHDWSGVSEGITRMARRLVQVFNEIQCDLFQGHDWRMTEPGKEGTKDITSICKTHPDPVCLVNDGYIMESDPTKPKEGVLTSRQREKIEKSRKAKAIMYGLAYALTGKSQHTLLSEARAYSML